MTTNKTKQVLVPKLRYREFDYSWTKSTIGNVCRMQAGNFVKATEIYNEELKGMFPCYGGNGLRGFTKTFNYEGKYTLIGRQGAHCGNVKLANGKFHATEHAVVVSLSKEFDADWIFYLLYNSNLNQYSTGQAQPGLSVKNIEKLGVIVPSLPEQQKIASFLSSVDEKIQQLTRKKELLEQYKKGVMQQLFSGKLRFKDENGKEYSDWSLRKISDVLYEHKLKSTGKEEVFSVSVHKGLINQIEHLGRVFAAKNTDNYNLVKTGDIVYTKSPTGSFPLGIIKQSKVNKDVIVSPLYGIFTPETQGLGYMLNVYFESPINANNYLASIIQKGAKNTINITNTTFLSKKMKLPVSKEEQNKIGNFLEQIDSKIESATQQITDTQTFKKGLLQKMFV